MGRFTLSFCLHAPPKHFKLVSINLFVIIHLAWTTESTDSQNISICLSVFQHVIKCFSRVHMNSIVSCNRTRVWVDSQYIGKQLKLSWMIQYILNPHADVDSVSFRSMVTPALCTLVLFWHAIHPNIHVILFMVIFHLFWPFICPYAIRFIHSDSCLLYFFSFVLSVLFILFYLYWPYFVLISITDFFYVFELEFKKGTK